MAIERPHVGRLAAQQVVYVPVVTPRAEMGQAVQAALEEISEVFRAQQMAPAGPWFAHHHRRPTETFDFDVCFPVAGAVALGGRLHSASLPAMDVVRTAYHGPYEGLSSAWGEFIAWIEGQAYAVRKDFFEIYSIGPREAKEPEAWQTDLIFPLMEIESGKERLI